MLQFSIITISSFVTILNECVKYFSETFLKKNINKYIPIFSIAFGIILGIVGYYLDDVEMGNNLIEAIFIGISAGSTATGINQVGKQLKRDENIDCGEKTLSETEIQQITRITLDNVFDEDINDKINNDNEENNNE